MDSLDRSHESYNAHKPRRDCKAIVARHINNAFKEGELKKESNMHFLHNTQYRYRPLY